MTKYEKIYDYVNGKLINSGKNFRYCKETFLLDVGNEPRTLSVSKYLELENEKFAQAIYVAIYNQLPDNKFWRKWTIKFHLPRDQFQRAFLWDISKSAIVSINHFEIIDNPYFRQRRGIYNKMIGMIYGLTNNNCLRTFAKKLPPSIQCIIRKNFQ